MILRDKVKVERYTTGVKDPTGVSKQVLSVITASLPCDLQPNGGVVVVPSAGQTAIYYKTMFCYRSDIKENDIITDLSSGAKMKVVNINDYGILPHMEVNLQGGTVK